MRTRLQRLLRAALPRQIIEAIERRWFRVRWTGDYPDWRTARSLARGYDAPMILDRVAKASRLVRDGRAAYERDGITFARPEARPEILSALRRASASGRLSVLDIGGALGSSFWQYRPWFEGTCELSWTVVEQEHFVALGRNEFEGRGLQFSVSIDAACADSRPNVVLLSSVLPYLESPHAWLDEIVARRIPHVVIDRTGIVTSPTDRLTLQHVPRRIYPATYPCWFFNRERLLAHFTPGYKLASEYDTGDGGMTGFHFKGFVLTRLETE